MPERSGRRSFLGHSLAAGAGLALPARWTLGQSIPPAPVQPPDSVRFAHLTDIHVQPELNAQAGMARALAQAQSRGATLVLNGGDAVMDVFAAGRPRAEVLKKLWRTTCADECSVPMRHVVGNHDILGWNRSKSGLAESEADWGKKFSAELLGLERTYHAFDLGAWRIICLDSTQPQGDSYVAYCDDAQTDWLQRTLAQTPASMPVCVVSHIPILTLTMLTWDERKRADYEKPTEIPAAEMHTDGSNLHALFRKHGGVKLCLSGHIHLLDRCELDGITYICDGAVSGSWWKGPHRGMPEGFGLIDLKADGSFAHQYETYGWQATAAD